MNKHTSLLIMAVLLCSQTLFAADYFWIGGSGNWSDISHWATTSNGVITHSQAPTAADDVFFDFNSFDSPGQVVTLNSNIVFCRNMTWDGVANNPTLSGGSDVIFNIYGSWSLNPNMTFDFSGRTLFTGDLTDNTVSFGTQSCGQDITFSGTGTWTLAGGIQVDSAFIFTEGTLNTNGQNIDCLYFDSRSSNNRTLNLGTSAITINGATIDHPFEDQVIQPLHIHASNLTMDGGNSIFIFSNSTIDIWIQGPGTVNFNRVVLFNAMGNSRIMPWIPSFNVADTPTMNFNEINLFHSATLLGSQQIGDLILHANQQYFFESDQTYTFNSIEAFGDCSNTIVLESTGGANPALFTSSNNITTSFTSLRGIEATGTGVFTANNAIDLGNNAGWTINPRTPDDFFWVGGTGNWNDPAHWSFTSGGPSSGCIPAAQDDVFFDVNSFSAANQSVTVNIENAYCHNMSWLGATNNPSLSGPIENSLHITASLDFAPVMQHDFSGNYYFESEEAANTITTSGHPFNNSIYFSGVNGEWLFQNDIYIENDINFFSGTLRTNGHDLELAHFFSLDDFSRSLFLGNSHITLVNHQFGSADWNVNSTNLNFDAGTSTIESNGNTSNLIRSFGEGNMIYNNIIFNSWEGRLFSNIDAPGNTVEIDSIIFNKKGFVSDDNIVNYWKMTAGHKNVFTNGSTQTITELDANGDCTNGLVAIEASAIGYTVNFDIANDHTLDRLSLHGIHQIGTGVLQANNSFDGGDNLGWMFTNGAGRDLYWVGGDGQWSEMAHWSLSSGGPGGECIPTLVDNVFFDNNSFPAAGATLRDDLNNDVFCRNMTWEAGITTLPTLQLNYINVYGSLNIQSDVEWNGFSMFFRGEGNQTIETSGVAINNIFFENTAIYQLNDALNAEDIRLYRGTFNTNSQDVIANRFICDAREAPKNLLLGDTYMVLNGGSISTYAASFVVFSLGLTIDPGQSVIELTNSNAGISVDYAVDFNNILFSNPESDAYIVSDQSNFNKINFFGNGDLRGSLNTDTLLCSAGKSYVFDSNQTQTINSYWKIIGNNCTPISLTSNMVGDLANVNMPVSGSILADFIQMRDINAIGGANFLAGSHSTNISNSNVGWVFDTAPEFVDIGFLGPDLALCTDDPVTLSAYSFTANESYLWQDNSTDSILVVDQSGEYSVQVTFGDNCIIQDTIDIITAQGFMVDIEDDPALCEGETITLNANTGIVGAEYLWQDGSTADTLNVSTAGVFSVEVSIGDCVENDMTTVSVTTSPELYLGPDLSVCDGDDFTLQSNVIADSYLWQNASVLDQFTGSTQGLYWLEVTVGECVVRDSVNVSYVSNTAIDLGVDTLLCDQDNYLLSINIPGASYVWQDGSDMNNLLTTTTGEYWVEATVSGCSARDTINLTYQNNPAVEFGDEIFACEGDLIELSSPVVADSYLWSDGDMDTEFSTDQAGLHYLDATFGECVVREYFEIILSDLSITNSLGADTLLCDGDEIFLELNIPNATYEWQDGSTVNSFLVTTTGEYWVEATVMGCSIRDSINLTFQNNPAIEFGDEILACQGDLVELNSLVVADNYLWSDGDMDANFSTTQAGQYFLDATFGMCVVREYFEVVLSDTPNIQSLGPDTEICEGESLVLNAITDVGQVIWQDNSTNNNLDLNTAGQYWFTVDNLGCTSSDTINISLVSSPMPDLGEDIAACNGDEYEIILPTADGIITWSDGSNDMSLLVTNTATYWVDVEDTNGCVGRDSIFVNFDSNPTLDLGRDTSVCNNDPYVIQASYSDGLLTWMDGSTASSFVLNNSGTVTAIIENMGCMDTDTITVEFKECTVFEVYIPNVFSPNDDGSNDVFIPQFDDNVSIISYSIHIFNRWGSPIFSSNDYTAPWNGKFNNKIVDQGIYVYAIDVTYEDDEGIGHEVLKGDIMVLR